MSWRAVCCARRVGSLCARPSIAVLGNSDDFACFVDGAARSLGPGRRVAQIGASIGRDFSYAMLRAVSVLPKASWRRLSLASSPPSWCFSGVRRPMPSTFQAWAGSGRVHDSLFAIRAGDSMPRSPIR